MKKIIFALLIALMPLAADATAQTCEEFADVMTKKVLGVFHDEKSSEEQKKAVLASLFQEAVDIDWIGKFVLGRYWNQSTPEEQAEYLKSYRVYLTKIYISKFKNEDGMSIDNIKLVSTKPVNDGQFEAKTLVQSKGDADVNVDYLLKQTPGKCQVHDIKVEGISLLSSHRSEFGGLANKAGVKGVIEAMHKQIGS